MRILIQPIGEQPYFRLELGLIRYYDNGSSFLGAANGYIIRETGACGGEVSFSTLNCEDIGA